jgi:hypothetical protein
MSRELVNQTIIKEEFACIFVYCAPTKALVGEKKIELGTYYKLLPKKQAIQLLKSQLEKEEIDF